MKTVTDVTGLANLGTAIGKRIRAKPPQGGTSHLEMYLLGAERQRLRQELAYLEQRRLRFHRRLSEIQVEMTRLRQRAVANDVIDVSAEASPAPGDGNGHAQAPDYTRRQWKTIPVEY